MAGEVKLKFPNNQDVWTVVVDDMLEDGWVVDENSEYFIVEYINRNAADQAIARFNGLIEYEFLR